MNDAEIAYDIEQKMRGILYGVFYKNMRERKDNQVSVTETNHCLLNAYFERTAPIAPDIVRIRLMTKGRDIHTYYENGFGENGYSTATTISKWIVHNGVAFTLIGHPDAYNDTVVVDFKSYSSTPKDVPAKYIEQTNAYAGMLGKRKFVIAFDPQWSDPKAYVYEFKLIMYERTIDRAAMLAHALQKRTQPQPEKGSECTNCQYKAQCPAWLRR